MPVKKSKLYSSLWKSCDELRGGMDASQYKDYVDRDIDALDRYWQVLPAVRPLLFESAGRDGYSRLKLATSDVKKAIFVHPEFSAFNDCVTALFDEWMKVNAPRLRSLR